MREKKKKKKEKENLVRVVVSIANSNGTLENVGLGVYYDLVYERDVSFRRVHEFFVS